MLKKVPIISSLITRIKYGKKVFKDQKAKIRRKRKNRKVWDEYYKEKRLYNVKPLKNQILSWERKEETSNSEKATSLDLRKLKESYTVVSALDINDWSHWKLYIINGKTIKKVYVRTRDLDVAGSFKPKKNKK